MYMIDEFIPSDVAGFISDVLKKGESYSRIKATSVLGRGSSGTAYEVDGLLATEGWRRYWDEDATIIACTSCCMKLYGDGNAKTNEERSVNHACYEYAILKNCDSGLGSTPRPFALGVARVRDKLFPAVLMSNVLCDKDSFLLSKMHKRDNSEDLRRHNLSTVQEYAMVALELCKVICDVQGSGAFVGDLKPDNIVLHLTPFANDARKYVGHVTLIDVGSFAFTNEDRVDEKIASPCPYVSVAFGAPELFDAKFSKRRVNVTSAALWAFGAIVYFICTGGSPSSALEGFKQGQPVAMAKKSGLELPKREANYVDRSLWHTLSDIVHDCTIIDPDERHESISFQHIESLLDDAIGSSMDQGHLDRKRTLLTQDFVMSLDTDRYLKGRGVDVSGLIDFLLLRDIHHLELEDAKELVRIMRGRG